MTARPAADLLLIEDDAEDRTLVQELVAAKGHGRVHVTEAADLRTALELLAGRRFDLILLDTRLREASALAALRAVGEHAPHTPILPHATFLTVELHRAARQRGAWDVAMRGELDPLWHAVEQLLTDAGALSDPRQARAS